MLFKPLLEILNIKLEYTVEQLYGVLGYTLKGAVPDFLAFFLQMPGELIEISTMDHTTWKNGLCCAYNDFSV